MGKSIGIDGDNDFWRKLKSDHRSDFPGLIDRSNFNRRRKHMYPFIGELNQFLANRHNDNEDVYIVDSLPIPVCQIASANQSKILQNLLKCCLT